MSARWRARQRADEYVVKAMREGYRSRAAYKLKQIDARVQPRLLKRGMTAIELGASPGSWTQVLAERGVRVIGIDLLKCDPVEGAHFIHGDFMDPQVQQRARELLDGQRADLLLSDMSPNRSGIGSLGTLPPRRHTTYLSRGP
jgi:23S rRNA (uridine2552-2'-O)-methyltransferase